MRDASQSGGSLPRWIGGIGATLSLLIYGAALFIFPSILDWAFAQGGKAPLFIAVVGAAVVMGAYWALESLTTRVMRIRRARGASPPRPGSA